MKRGGRLLLVNAHGADEYAGGAEAYVARLVDGFTARGCEVAVLAAFPSCTRGRRIQTLHATHWRTSRSRRLLNHAGDVIATPTPKLEEAVTGFAPDLVHTNNLPGISTAVWVVARRSSLPVVHTLHDYHLLCPRVTLLSPDGHPCRPHPLFCGLRTRRLARWAPAVSHVIGVSAHILDRHAALFPGATLETIRHPAIERAQRVLRPPRDRLETIGYLGALEHTKGVLQLLDAAPALSGLGVAILVAGDGRLRSEVEARTKREPNIVYYGTLAGAEKDRFLEQSDAGIMPSVWEEPGAPTLVAIEWLSAGRPLLTSARGGMAEAVPDLAGAVKIEPSVQGITQAVEELRMPAAWREVVRSVRPPTEGDDLDTWLDKHERIYVGLLERGKR